jgi:hypothetical protein
MPDEHISAQAPREPATEQARAEWLHCQQEAETWIAPGGRLIDDPVLRNRRVSAAYASLWLEDPRFQWAGLAAFASRQVGCGLLHMAQTMQRLGNEIRASRPADNFEWLYKIMIPALVGTGTGYLRGQLSLGNLAVFLDVYPLHRFYARHGLAHMRETLAARQAIADRVHWPVPVQVLAFGKPFREIAEAFALVEEGRLDASVLKLAWHEQVNVLQPILYDDPKTRLALDANQLGAATGSEGGFEAIELTFGTACPAQEGATTVFSSLQNAHLYDIGQRMDFVGRAAAQFDALLGGGQRGAIAQALRDIAADLSPQQFAQ